MSKIEKKIDTARRIVRKAMEAYPTEDNKALCIEQIMSQLQVTKGNASIYYAKCIGVASDRTKPTARAVKLKTAMAPKLSALSESEFLDKVDKGSAKVRAEWNKAHAHLSYSEA